MSVSADCASAMVSRDQTATKSSRATVPISLRARMDMAGLRWLDCDAARMTIWSAPSPARTLHAGYRVSSRPFARAAAVAAGGGGDDFRHAGGRRRHAADRIGPVDRRMETGHRRVAAAQRAGLAGRIPE